MLHRHNNFKGILPRVEPTLLPEGCAVLSRNARLWSGEVRPFYGMSEISAIYHGINTKTIYPYRDAGATYWFNWDVDVSVAAPPVANDAFNRLYYTGDVSPRKTGRDIGKPALPTDIAPANWYYLGVTKPGTAPTATPAGGVSADIEDRAYIYTWVTGWGEEGAPSPAVTINMQVDASVTVTVPNAEIVGLDPKYNITKFRLYRTVPGTTEYLFVVEQVLASPIYVDALTSAGLGTALFSGEFDEPPANLESIVSLPNGFMAGISGNRICFSEPWFPYAWPERYKRTLTDTPVRLAVIGTALVVTTKGRPRVFSGVHPEQVHEDMLPAMQSCINGRSLASSAQGAVWASPDGLVLASPGATEVITHAIFSKREWELLRPGTMFGTVYDNRYYAWFDSDGNGKMEAMIFDPGEPNSVLTQFEADASAVYSDLESDGLYLVVGGKIMLWDADKVNPLTYKYRTRPIVDPYPSNKSVVQVKGSFTLSAIIGGTISFAQYNAITQAVIAYNAALAGTGDPLTLGVVGGMIGGSSLGGDPFMDLPFTVTDSVTIRVYGDDIMRFQGLVSSNEPIMLPSGYTADEWSVEIEGQYPIREILLANAVSELRGV